MDANTASLIETRGGGFWVKLIPGKMSEHEEVWLKARLALDEWSEAQLLRKAAKKRDQALDAMVETTRNLP